MSYNEGGEQTTDLVTVEVEVGLLIGKTDKIESSTLFHERATEEIGLFHRPSLVGARISLRIAVVLFSCSATEKLLEQDLSNRSANSLPSDSVNEVELDTLLR